MQAFASSLAADWALHHAIPTSCVCSLEKYAYAHCSVGVPTAPWLYVLADAVCHLSWHLHSESTPPCIELPPSLPGYIESKDIDVHVSSTVEACSSGLLSLFAKVRDFVLPTVSTTCASCLNASMTSTPDPCSESTDSTAVAVSKGVPPELSHDVVPLLAEVLEALMVRTLRRLCGLRETIGTVGSVLPPPRHLLLARFNDPFTLGIALSCGARALSKHAHRASEGFWGKVKGSNAVQNAYADGLVATLLDTAVWVNCHRLPHDECVLEVRQGDGYGARWSIPTAAFRGFLEPYIPDGHSVGWRH
jgi:hypothetical protein